MTPIDFAVHSEKLGTLKRPRRRWDDQYGGRQELEPEGVFFGRLLVYFVKLNNNIETSVAKSEIDR